MRSDYRVQTGLSMLTSGLDLGFHPVLILTSLFLGIHKFHIAVALSMYIVSCFHSSNDNWSTQDNWSLIFYGHFQGQEFSRFSS